MGATKENVSRNAEILLSLDQQLKKLIIQAHRQQLKHESTLSITNPGVPGPITGLQQAATFDSEQRHSSYTHMAARVPLAYAKSLVNNV